MCLRDRSEWYVYLLRVNPRFRAYRVRRECGPINWPSLRGDCIASFDQYEPFIGPRGWYCTH